MARQTVTNTIQTIDGVPLANVLVNIKLMPSGGFTSDTKIEVSREVNVLTNASGVWTASLESNLNILPSGSWYEVLEKIPKINGGNRVSIIAVAGIGGNLRDLLIDELPNSDTIYVPTYPIVKSAWANLPLLNGAGPIGGTSFYSPQYRLFDDRVECRGVCTLGDALGTWPANQVVTTFPVGYRPPKNLRFTVSALAVLSSTSTPQLVNILSTGDVSPNVNITNATMFFDGINFSITP